MYRLTKVITITLILTGMTCSMALAADADSATLLKDFLYRLLNFAIVVAILYLVLKKPIINGLSGRRDAIEKSLEEAKKAKEEAEAKFAEYDKKLSLATEEIASISTAIRQEAEAEKAKIIANANAMAAKIEQDAERAADLEVEKAKMILQQEAVQLAVSIAKDLLINNFTKEDDGRLIDEYMKKVGDLH